MNIALLTVGSRGDVQPFVALARGLQDAGHRVTLAAPSDAEALVVAHDVPYASLGVDFRAMVDSPEATGATAFLALPAPLVAPTRAFPIPAGVFPDLGQLNRATYAVSRLGMLPYHRTMNAWRAEAFRLPDWPGHVHVTGFWHLDGATPPYEPPRDLARFLESGPPPVYVGFGSMAGRKPERTTMTVREAVRRAGVRAVVARGWGGLVSGDVGRSPRWPFERNLSILWRPAVLGQARPCPRGWS